MFMSWTMSPSQRPRGCSRHRRGLAVGLGCAVAAVGTMIVGGGAVPRTADAALVARYRFDEPDGPTAVDSAGAHDGTLVNGPVREPVTGPPGTGLGGTALNLDGADDYVDLGAGTDLLQNAAGATISAWVRPDRFSATSGLRSLVFINRNGDTERARATLTLSNNTIQFGGRSAGDANLQQISTTANPGGAAVGTWFHVAGVMDFAADLITIYVNGAPVASGTVSFASARAANDAAGPSVIGTYGNKAERFFDGQLDDLRVYDEPLTAAQIAQEISLPEPTGFATVAATALSAGLLRRRRRTRTSSHRTAACR
jgi:hypothetical protein